MNFDGLWVSKLICNCYIGCITLISLQLITHNLFTELISQCLNMLQCSIPLHLDAFNLVVLEDIGEIVLNSNDPPKNTHYIQMVLDLLLTIDNLIHSIPFCLYPDESHKIIKFQTDELQEIELFFLLTIIDLFRPALEEIGRQRELECTIGIGLNHK